MVTRRDAITGLAGAGLAGVTGGLAEAGGDAAKLAAFAKARDDSLRQFARDGRYLPVWSSLTGGNTVIVQDLVEQWAAFLGDEKTALAHAANAEPAPANLADSTDEDAVAAVVKASAGRRVVMLNEAHCASRHRMFLAHLLRALRKEGFTHLAAEDFLSTRDPAAPRVEPLGPGDSLSPLQGNYSCDPVLAEAIRDALNLGYRLVSYEERQDQRDPSADPTKVGRNREQAQATNLAEAMAQAPDGRFLVYVGYGHIVKALDAPGGERFAGRFMRDTGIEPLTVVQDSLGSFGPHAPDSPQARALLARFKADDPFVVRSPQGRLWGAAGWADILVAHPSLPDAHRRPGWLARGPDRRLASVPLPTARHAGPVLAQAVPINKARPMIPADQYLLSPGAREAAFYLRPGRYHVRLETAAGFTPLGEVTA